ncbi:MAG: radical SAM family heme chaperone HemW [Deltaproteobacteria bacterium]|nr:radical SAM family heme chaperone HemW [Deltaproteobacteria bacterium]
MAAIYHHTPFCLSKCHYCDFYSLAWGGKQVPHLEFLEALSREAKRWHSFISKKIDAETLYFGGGTPSLLDPNLVESIINEARDLSRLDFSEITLEVNPKTADLNKLKEYKKRGVNRISMGLQSLNDKLLHSLGRAHTGKEALQSLEYIYAAGFTKVNVDIMYGLPEQTMSDVQETLRELNEFPLKHISAYQLIVEEHTPFYQLEQQGKLNLPAEEVVEEMELAIQNFTYSKKMSKYEVSNYAVPNHESLHNLNYWSYQSFIGLGPGAVSFLKKDQIIQIPELSKKLKMSDDSIYAWRLTNPRDLQSYLKNSSSWQDVSVEEISLKTAQAEFMLMGLRKRAGVNYQDFENTFAEKMPESFNQSIEKEINLGRMEVHDEGVLLTDLGHQFLNSVIENFI